MISMKKFRWDILFIIVGVLTILEFTFIRGLFTWLMVVFLSIGVGSINIILQLKDKNFTQAALYTICTIALCMGYMAII